MCLGSVLLATVLMLGYALVIADQLPSPVASHYASSSPDHFMPISGLLFTGAATIFVLAAGFAWLTTALR